MVDIISFIIGIVVDMFILDKVLVFCNLMLVVLLVLGIMCGDFVFGDLFFIGGVFVGENVYYVNGLNIINFCIGVGFSELLFDMYDMFEVKIGGYLVEFGCVIGGVINVKIKSGINEFKWGVNVYYEFDLLCEDCFLFFFLVNDFYRINNDFDKSDLLDYNIWLSGVLIEDKLFYYVLVNLCDVE